MSIAETCSGSLIAPRFVLTAAHCFNKPEFAVVNSLDGKKDWDLYRVNASEARHRGVKAVNVQRVIRHPSFNATGVMENDIAVLKLTEDVKVKDMPRLYGRPTFMAKAIYVLGYGQHELGQLGDYKLRRARLIVLRDEKCGLSFAQSCAKTNCICAGDLHKGTASVSFPNTKPIFEHRATAEAQPIWKRAAASTRWASAWPAATTPVTFIVMPSSG